MMRRLFPCLAALLFLAALPVSAQTPDGETPAEEDVCDVLIGGTPGLYGLCVAYCEAQDADVDIGMFSGAVCSSRNSHDRLLDNYRKKMKAGDPDMPCLRPACPCFDVTDLAAIGSIKNTCEDNTAQVQLFGLDDESRVCKGIATVVNDKLMTQGECSYRLDIAAGGRICKKGEITTAKLNADEVASCRALLLSEIELRGLECGKGTPEEPVPEEP